MDTHQPGNGATPITGKTSTRLDAVVGFPTFGNIAKTLVSNGYSPVPIKLGTKRPPMQKWQSFRADDNAIRAYRSLGVGILCGQTVCVDIDVLHEQASMELHELANDHFGYGLPRVGVFPKIALIYRTETPFRKKLTESYNFDGFERAQKVEVLAEGQQFVAFAIHPDTSQPYEWLDGPSIIDVPHSELTAIDEAQVDEFIAQANTILARYGTAIRPAREPDPTPEPRQSRSAPNGNHGSGNRRQQAYVESALAAEVSSVAGAPKSTRNNALNAAAFALGTLVPHGLLDEGTIEAELEAAASKCGLVKDKGRKAALDTIASGLHAGMLAPRKLPDFTEVKKTPRINGGSHPISEHDPDTGEVFLDNSSELPCRAPRRRIRVMGGDLASSVDEATKALIEEIDPMAAIYVSGSFLMRPIRMRAKLNAGGMRRPMNALVLSKVDGDWLRLRLAQTADFYVKGKRTKEDEEPPDRDVDPPIGLCRSIIAASPWPEFPVLTGIIEAPTILPDGSLVQHPGYDDNSGLLFDPAGASFPEIPVKPTRDQALEALRVLREPFGEFRFSKRAQIGQIRRLSQWSFPLF